jgi:hypothetical protein
MQPLFALFVCVNVIFASGTDRLDGGVKLSFCDVDCLLFKPFARPEIRNLFTLLHVNISPIVYQLRTRYDHERDGALLFFAPRIKRYTVKHDNAEKWPVHSSE